MSVGAQQVFTGHDFATEAEAWSRFDELVAKFTPDVFRATYREVPGWYVQPRPDTDAFDDEGRPRKGPRIDRILHPGTKLIEAGWRSGLIGVEAKCSEKKIGRPVSQAMDYARAVFELPGSGILVMVRWVFVWPLAGEPKGDVGSIMAQNRIGWVDSSNRTPLVFGCGGMRGITLNHDGTVEVKAFPMGRKVGSR